MRSCTLSGLVVLAVLVGVAPANAVSNLVTNSYFNSSINAWTAAAAGHVNVAWSSSDVHGSSSSGSAALQNYDANAMASSVYWIGLRQCLPVTAGTSYHMSGYIGIPAAQTRTGRAAIAVQYYNGNICSGTKIGNPVFAINTHADNTWHAVSSDTTAPAGAGSVSINLDTQKDQAGGAFYTFYDEVVFYSTSPSGTCSADATHLCLTGNRFRVSMQWTNYNTNVTKAANAVPFAGETGFFYFDDPSNLELMVKVHNACPSFGHFWVFAAATTNVGYTLTVTDTLTTQTQQYSNLPYVLSPAITDQSTFGSCP